MSEEKKEEAAPEEPVAEEKPKPSSAQSKSLGEHLKEMGILLGHLNEAHAAAGKGKILSEKQSEELLLCANQVSAKAKKIHSVRAAL